ncbi:hypothetical protein CLV43_10594 [Umezawaea tangerina]|uniref:Uncharacterized protein n=2 Tax=Umezawaea tangerina TaxID=84725 RepID=A0A2T0T6N9_9PSEU|nr:hypothetical protein CLV43_10594 [Umezawaea tangerina]
MLAAPSMAEALVLTVDAPSLTRVSASSDVARLAVVVRRWIHERGPSGTEPSRLLPVVLAITHMDQLDKNKTLEEVVALFDPLRAVGATSSRITGLTVSVNAGSPSGHCALPLLWGLRHGIPAMANEVTAVWPVGPLPAWSWGSNGFDRKRATWHP